MQDVVDAAGTVVARFRSDLVDVEAQPLPYPDGAFDTVLLCEVIEHFVADPVSPSARSTGCWRPAGGCC